MNKPTTDQQAVTVAQEDRHAAGLCDPANRVDYKEGKRDGSTLVQTLARHRLASVSSASAEEYKLPCDVHLPHAAVVKAGCDLSTLKLAMEYEHRPRYFEGNPRAMLTASPEPVPATSQAGEVEVEAVARAMCDRVNGVGDYDENIQQRRSGWVKQAEAGIAAYLVATQPATSQEGEGALRAEVKRLRELLGDYGEKRAPVQGLQGGIPWDMHLRAYDEYCRQYSPQKALIEGGCRGGFGVRELDKFIPGWRDELKARADAARAATPTPPTMSEGLRELSERATPGPWAWEQCGEMEDVPVIGIAFPGDDHDCKTPYESEFRDSDASRMTIAYDWQSCDGHPPSANAAFAVAAVNYVRAALARAQGQAS